MNPYYMFKNMPIPYKYDMNKNTPQREDSFSLAVYHLKRFGKWDE